MRFCAAFAVAVAAIMATKFIWSTALLELLMK
jgi:hypothetical protein